jgi:hypothetical protein
MTVEVANLMFLLDTQDTNSMVPFLGKVGFNQLHLLHSPLIYADPVNSPPPI